MEGVFYMPTENENEWLSQNEKTVPKIHLQNFLFCLMKSIAPYKMVEYGRIITAHIVSNSWLGNLSNML